MKRHSSANPLGLACIDVTKRLLLLWAANEGLGLVSPR
jgi:hypothetical protein